jgi:anti-anti-sigma factor
MDIKESKKGDVLVVALAGKLDAISSPELEKRLLEAIDEGGKKVVLDLTRLDYVSSAGVRVFLLAMKRLKEKGGHLHFCGLIPDVRRVFDITGFAFRVPLFDTLDAAVAGFATPPG